MIDVTVYPKKGYVGNNFTAYAKAKVDMAGVYRILLVLDDKKVVGSIPTKDGVFVKAGKTFDGSRAFKVSSVGSHKITAHLQRYEQRGWIGLGKWVTVETDQDSFEATTSQTGETCTAEEYRDSMVRTYRNSDRLIGWANSYSPIIDVTDIVQKVYPNVTHAELTVYGDDLSKIGIIGPFSERPAPRDPVDIVNGWILGTEFVRNFCPKDGMHYWVTFPCKLVMKTSDGGGDGGGDGGIWPAEISNVPLWLIILALLAGGYFIIKRRRSE